MEFFSTFRGYCRGYDQKQDRWRVDTEQKQRKTEEDKSQPLINLGLGIGGSTSFREKDNNFDSVMNKVVVKQEIHDHHDDHVVERVGCRKFSVVRFTEDQMEELKRQLLIFKYMIWGLPVPFQLVLPIWRSFSSCPRFFPYKSSLPLLVAYFRGGFNHQQMTDLEPERCRRTDGKKWRCHQAVIPNEKYCEKHMHRGRKRSRKLVEASPNSETPNLMYLNRNNYPNRDYIRPKFSESLAQNGPTKGMSRAPSLTNTTAKIKNNKARCDFVVNQRIAVINRASAVDFSSKSLLQNDMGIKHPAVKSCKNSPEVSESRCKRTDGKKWQCKKEVVPDQKYCAQHINRGKNRSVKASFGSSTSGSAAKTRAHGSSDARFSGTEQLKSSLSLDTSLKISLPTSLANDPRNIIKDDSLDRNGSSSSSTEATVSDDSTSNDVSDIITLSP